MNNYNRTNMNYNEINAYIEANHNKDNYYCEKCNYRTNKCYIYDTHLESIQHKTCKGRSKSEMKIYKCGNCNYENYNKNKYLNHLLNIHYTTAERRDKCNFYCRSCDVAIPVDTMLDYHFKSKKHLLNIYEIQVPQKQIQPLFSIENQEYIYEINNGIRP